MNKAPHVMDAIGKIVVTIQAHVNITIRQGWKMMIRSSKDLSRKNAINSAENGMDT